MSAGIYTVVVTDENYDYLDSSLDNNELEQMVTFADTPRTSNIDTITSNKDNKKKHNKKKKNSESIKREGRRRRKRRKNRYK